MRFNNKTPSSDPPNISSYGADRGAYMRFVCVYITTVKENDVSASIMSLQHDTDVKETLPSGCNLSANTAKDNREFGPPKPNMRTITVTIACTCEEIHFVFCDIFL